MTEFVLVLGVDMTASVAVLVAETVAAPLVDAVAAVENTADNLAATLDEDQADREHYAEKMRDRSWRTVLVVRGVVDIGVVAAAKSLQNDHSSFCSCPSSRSVWKTLDVLSATAGCRASWIYGALYDPSHPDHHQSRHHHTWISQRLTLDDNHCMSH